MDNLQTASDSELVSAIRSDLGREYSDLEIDSNDLRIFRDACGQDFQRLLRYIKRRSFGEPVPYILGYLTFRGRRFKVDKRVYITDPEATYLVDALVDLARNMQSSAGREVVLAEIGTGCGSLGISAKMELPDARIIALEIDSDALDVAAVNVARHDVDVELVESDLFASWPLQCQPDIIFGDPPWGDDTSVYDDSRPIEYYLYMPRLSVFPTGGITGIHEQILEAVRARGWRSEILLNVGVIDPEQVQRLAEPTAWHRVITPAQGISILHCRML